MRILITGGGGFIGSHMAEHFVLSGHKVILFDNLSRLSLIKGSQGKILYNWQALKRMKNITAIEGDVRDFGHLRRVVEKCDVIIHCAGQTAVTTSIVNPRIDFEINALGSFNVLESARLSSSKPTVLFCSTNKVYGKNVNEVPIEKRGGRYLFVGKYKKGIPETFSLDRCSHSPYGCSKLTADIYMQDYAETYGLKVGVFRMSCIYGAKQFGFEDQGWIAWFAIAALLKKAITIYGDGCQVRDVLYVSDLVNLFERFIKSPRPFGIYNTGGGYQNVISLKDLVRELEAITGKKLKLRYGDWRPSDQKVYISDTRKAQKELGWQPKVSFPEGLSKLVDWLRANTHLFRV